MIRPFHLMPIKPSRIKRASIGLLALLQISCDARSTGLHANPDGWKNDYAERDLDEPHDGYVEALHIGGGDVEIHLEKTKFAASREQLVNWVASAAHWVSNYLGRFPVKHVVIGITAADDSEEIHGTEYDGQLLRLRIGRKVTQTKLADDWTMTHEMLHLAYPSMGDDHLWMNEGLSVYLEPVCRARAGVVSTTRYWRELVEGLPNGQPEAGDRGLDRTHTWGRTYWGGTIFWFVVDLRIRVATHDAKSIRDVVRAILDAGGDGGQEWSMQRVIDVGDRATGTHAMAETYAETADKPVRVDVDEWYRRLGVRYENGNVSFDDAAPLAQIRQSITRPQPLASSAPGR